MLYWQTKEHTAENHLAMLPQRQTRRSASRVFLISGIPETEREELGQMIQKLGAVYLKTDVSSVLVLLLIVTVLT